MKIRFWLDHRFLSLRDICCRNRTDVSRELVVPRNETTFALHDSPSSVYY